MDLATAPITELAARIARRELSPIEVVGAALARAAELDGILHCWATLDREGALAAAVAAEAALARGEPVGPLHGIPVGVKDNLRVAGIPLRAGGPAAVAGPSTADAGAVARLRRTGAVVLGTTTLHEWAMGGTSSGGPGGPVRNPWCVDRVPGGSSGGSAAGVAAGLAGIALGTDGMGSIRTPAAWCGVVGLKPTRGLVGRSGQVPATDTWNDEVGPIARSVGDLRLALRAIAGPDPRDPTSRTRPPDAPGRRPGAVPVVARVRSPLLDDVTPAVAAAADEAVALLAAAGARIVELELPALARARLAAPLLGGDANRALLPLALAGPAWFARPEIRHRILAATAWSAADVERAARVVAALRAEVAAALVVADALVLPTVPTPAVPIGAERWQVGGGTELALGAPGGQARVTTRLTLPFNLAGGPAVSVPAPSLVDGLPVGVQLVGRSWEDEELLDLAAVVEAGGGRWRPPAGLPVPPGRPASG